jgi:hypothetical protein
MGLVWSNEQGRFIDEEEQLNPTPGGVEASTPADVSSINPDGTRKSSFDLFRERAIAEQTANQQQAVDMLKDGPESTKPVLAQGPGQATTEVLRQLGNAGTALVTDYADLGAGIVDTFVQGGNALQGKGFDFDEWFNDSNNPLTKGRLEFFEPETQVGDAVRPWIRGGVALLTLPKQLLKWGLVTPLKMAAKVPVAGKAANLALKGGSKVKGAAKAKVALQADELAKVDALTDLSKIVSKGSKAEKLPASMARSAWLFAGYDDIGKAVKAGAPLQGMQAWMDDVANGVKGTIANVKGMPNNVKIRTIGEALAWDAFVAFNMAGEGNDYFDEGFSNMLVESDWGWANAIGSPLATTADDNAITRKFKGTVEGTLMGAILNPLFDMYRLYRYSRNFRRAGPKQQAEILKRLSAQAQDIGTSMGENQMKLLPAAGQSSRPLGTDQLMESVTNRRVTDDEIAQQIQMQRAEEAAAGSELRRAEAGIAAEEAAVAAEEAATSPVPGMSRADYEVANRGSRALEAAPGEMVQGGEFIPVRVAVDGEQVLPRPPEPVVTPQTIRNAFGEDARKYAESVFVQSDDGSFRQMTSEPPAMQSWAMRREAEANIKKTMPRNRVDALEYLQENPPTRNRYFVTDAVDNVWNSFVTRKALEEGWATIDPLNMNVKFNRRMAMDLDLSDKARAVGRDLDEAVDLELYSKNTGANLDGDPGMEQVTDRMVRDATQAAQYEVSEQLRLSAAQAVKGSLGDAEIVREMTDTTLDAIQKPIVQKREVGRGWEVVGADGEVIGNATTKRAAQKIADQELKTQRQELINRARQMEADMLDEGIEDAMEPIVESDIQATIKLTQKQKEEIMRYLPRVAQETINEPGSNIKRSFDFSLSEIEQLQDGWKALLQTSDLSPARRRVIKNLTDKFATSAKLMQPEVRARKQVDKMLAQTESIIKNGENCDFL